MYYANEDNCYFLCNQLSQSLCVSRGSVDTGGHAGEETGPLLVSHVMEAHHTSPNLQCLLHWALGRN